MFKKIVFTLCALLCVSACSKPAEPVTTPEKGLLATTTVGEWIVDAEGNVMFDPQTSGLVLLDGMLTTIADASAESSQQLKLHMINPSDSRLVSSTPRFHFASSVRRSCFYNYLNDQPDLEALAVDPRNPDVIYTVTEDATRTGALSTRCEAKFAETGSTDYPTLLVKLTRLDDGRVEVSNVRPLQFASSLEVGNFPNDGIEGLTMDKDGTLYLGLEKDKAGQPRIFTLNIDDNFWSTGDFAPVKEPNLILPTFSAGNHPINGLALYSDSAQGTFIIAAARNDNELWIIDISGDKDTKRIPVTFKVNGGEACGQYLMDNASMEGLIVEGDTLWIINDPWEKNYMKNAICEADTKRYENLAPLLFPVTINSKWFE